MSKLEINTNLGRSYQTLDTLAEMQCFIPSRSSDEPNPDIFMKLQENPGARITYIDDKAKQPNQLYVFNLTKGQICVRSRDTAVIPVKATLTVGADNGRL